MCLRWAGEGETEGRRLKLGIRGQKKLVERDEWAFTEGYYILSI